MPDCPICFDDLRTNLCTTDPCGHIFHRQCLAGWARSTQNKRCGSTTTASCVKCPSCNKGTKGFINIYIDFSTDYDVNDDVNDSKSVSRSSACSVVLEKKVNDMKAQLRAKNDAVNEMQVKLSALPEIEDACNELDMQLVNERLQKSKLMREYRKMEEVANKRMEDMNRKWTIRHSGLQAQLQAAQDEVKTLKPIQDDMEVVRYESQKARRELQQARSELEQKRVEMNGLMNSREESKSLLRDAKQKLTKYQLQGRSNYKLEQENILLKSKLIQMTKELEESKECFIEPRRSSITKNVLKSNKSSSSVASSAVNGNIRKKNLNPFQCKSNKKDLYTMSTTKRKPMWKETNNKRSDQVINNNIEKVIEVKKKRKTERTIDNHGVAKARKKIIGNEHPGNALMQFLSTEPKTDTDYMKNLRKTPFPDFDFVNLN